MRKLFIIIVILFTITSLSGTMAEMQQTHVGKPGTVYNAVSFGEIPLYFFPNHGRFREQAEFYARTPGYTLWMTKSGLVFDSIRQSTFQGQSPKTGERKHASKLPGEFDREVSRLLFLNANPDPDMKALKGTGYEINYFKGNNPSHWKTGIQASQAVLYDNLYPGVDLKVYGKQDEIEYDWEIAPGHDPERIRFKIAGCDNAGIDADGNIVLQTRFGDIVHQKPYAYQIIEGKTIPVAVKYLETDDQVFSFDISACNPDYALTIDPVVALEYSTYLGGSSFDYAYGIAVDTDGCAYVTGETFCSDFPIVNALQSDKPALRSAFITKFSAEGRELVYSTYLDGSSMSAGHGIAVDENGCVYVAGNTESDDFPIKNPFQAIKAGGVDLFMTKLTADGRNLVYSTFLGGSNDDYQWGGIALDSSGGLYITGATKSPDFPLSSPIQISKSRGTDAFVVKFAADGMHLDYATYLGGSGFDYGKGIAVDAGGCACVTGQTLSEDFPVSAAMQTHIAGDSDAFAAKFSEDGHELIYATYLGGLREDQGLAVTVSPEGEAYVTGRTESYNFPVVDAFQDSKAGETDAFVTKFAADGQSLDFSSYLGGSDHDIGSCIDVNTAGHIYVGGHTYSLDFPVRDPVQENLAGSTDIFVTKLEAGGHGILKSTFLGGSDWDWGMGMAVDGSGSAYLTGSVWGAGSVGSSDFPVKNAFQPDSPGYDDAFVVKFYFFPDVCPFDLISPFDGAQNRSIDTDLDWEDAAHAVSYDVYFGTVYPPPFFDTVKNSAYDPGPLEYKRTYYWKIKAVNAETSYESDIWSFQTILPPFISIEGKVIYNGSGLAEVTLAGLPSTPKSGGTGYYMDTVEYGWSGTVTPVLSGYAFNPDLRQYTAVKTEQTGQDYQASLIVIPLSGKVLSGKNGLKGVTLKGLPEAPVSADDGFYSGEVLFGWSGTVMPFKAGYRFTPVSRSYTEVTTGKTQQNYHAEALMSVSGCVTDGTGPLEGVMLDGMPGNPQTGEDGSYFQYIEKGWSGVVTPVLGGYVFTPADREYIDVQSDIRGEDYSADEDADVLGISGKVKKKNIPLANVVLNGLPLNPVTNEDGLYVTAIRSGWSGTVVPAASGYRFNPETRNYEDVTGELTGQDYLAAADSRVRAVSGTVMTPEGAALAEMPLNGLPHNPVTNPSGFYLDTVPQGWSGPVSIPLWNYDVTPAEVDIKNIFEDQIHNFTAERAYVEISGKITAQGAGIENVVLKGLPGNTQTGEDGTYSGIVDAGWSGEVIPALSGYIFVPQSRVYHQVTEDNQREDYRAHSVRK
jgi:hypothetical protein